jgi:hypothetical protein
MAPDLCFQKSVWHADEYSRQGPDRPVFSPNTQAASKSELRGKHKKLSRHNEDLHRVNI